MSNSSCLHCDFPENSPDSLLFSNSTDRTVPWINSFEKTIAVIIYNQKGSPVRASRLLPNQSLLISPGCSVELISMS